MFRFSRFAFPAAFAAMVLGPAPGAADSFTASVSQREVVTGDPFRIVLEWQGSGAAQGEPALENPDAAPLSGPSVSSSMFNYNGRVSQTRSWSWTAFAERDGEIDFGTAKIVVGGRTYTAEIPVVKAGPPPPQPFVRLSMASDKAEVLVDEEFTVAVTLDVAAPARLGGALPFAPRNPPLLRIPHLGGGEGFGPCRAVREPFDAVKDFVVRAGLPGVRLNSFARRDDPFEAMGFGGFGGSLHSAFGEAQPYVFAFPAEEFAENGTNYLRQTVAATFRAEALGECAFPAARFEGAVIAHVGADGRSARLSPPVVALSPGVRVKVVPPPAAGRPDAFFGALGTSLSPSVSLDTQSCRQGDPIELTLRLDGDLVPSTVGKIDIFSVPGIAESFRAWGDAERRDDGAVPVFHFKVRPVAAGTLEIPPIPLAYFDTVERAYKVVATDPVPLRVDPVADFDPSALFAAAATNDAVQRLLVASSGPVAPSISLSDAGFAPRRIVSRRALAALFISAPAAWLFPGLLPVAGGGISRSAAALRKGRARSRAEAALRSADSPQRVMEAVRALLRDRWGEDVPGMTPSDLREALARHGVGGEDARRAAALVQE
ncbi:MAG: BatD family protein, partial [Kiritimatiellae bacterium]|nr:BatD family protein [Kiritimatiellia bacterium]